MFELLTVANAVGRTLGVDCGLLAKIAAAEARAKLRPPNARSIAEQHRVIINADGVGHYARRNALARFASGAPSQPLVELGLSVRRSRHLGRLSGADQHERRARNQHTSHTFPRINPGGSYDGDRRLCNGLSGAGACRG